MDEGDDAQMCFTRGALQGIYLVDSLDARGPTAPTELTAIVTLRFFSWRRSELGAFASTSAGVYTENLTLPLEVHTYGYKHCMIDHLIVMPNLLVASIQENVRKAPKLASSKLLQLLI